MKLSGSQLARHLQRELAPVYLVAGEEPLLLGQALTRIREAARARGFEERDLHVVERGFPWSDLTAAADNLSLFAARRIVEIRLASPRPGDAGGRAIRDLVEQADPDRLLLIAVNAKLDAAASRSAWLASIEKHGVRVDVWPLDRVELPRWISARAAELGLRIEAAAAELLADRVEGNLLAADQELIKLSLGSPGRVVDEDAVLAAVANSARFDVFRLSDAIIDGDARRALRILSSLRVEGVQPALVAWAVSREIGLLARLKYAVQHGESADRAMSRHRVWRRRQAAVGRALDRYAWSELTGLMAHSARVDSTIKGVGLGRPWEALTSLVIATLDRNARSKAGAAYAAE